MRLWHRAALLAVSLLLLLPLRAMAGAENPCLPLPEDAQITALFPDPHGKPDASALEVDLDGDGVPESVRLVDLGYCGGDGGYRLEVYGIRDGEEIPLDLPDAYAPDRGFPFRIVWDGALRVYAGELCVCEFSGEQTRAFYRARDMEADFLQVQGDAYEAPGDAVSGFAVLDSADGSAPMLVTKSYLSGLWGHADCLGYGIAALRLRANGDWDVFYAYLPDGGEAQP